MPFSQWFRQRWYAKFNGAGSNYDGFGLFAAIKEGGAAVKLSKDMPAWKDGMDDDEIRNLVAYVRSLCNK